MRTIQLDDDDAVVVFRGRLGEIDLDAPTENEDGVLLNGLLAQALVRRCSEDPNFVDEQIQWLLRQQIEPLEEVFDDPS